MNRILFHHQTRDGLSEAAREGSSVVVPLAATEQHGLHLPVYTDSIICEHIVSQSVLKAAQAVPVLMAPVLTIGCSNHHLDFGGTISFSSSTYLQMLTDVGSSLVNCGFTKIIFLNGHGGNDLIMSQAANDLAVRYPIWTAAASYWSIARSALEQVHASETGMVPGHAGGFETSAILALQPDLVRKEHIQSTHERKSWIGWGPQGTFVGKHKQLTGCDGYTDAANKATVEKGEQYLQVIVDSVTEWLIAIYKLLDNDE